MLGRLTTALFATLLLVVFAWAAAGERAPQFDHLQPALAVNIGGLDYVDSAGVAYNADNKQQRVTQSRYTAISGTLDAALYGTYQTGELQLTYSLPAGDYDVTLLFIEPDDLPVGERVFDVLLQGKKRIAALDVRAARDGNSYAALSRTVSKVVVKGNGLTIKLAAIRGQPVLSGLLVRPGRLQHSDWQLVWADEFDNPGAPDKNHWTIENWPAGKVNDEQQAYTDRSKNVRVENGHLILEAHRESYQGAQYTSARIHSQGKADLLYGRVDVRARLPAGRGTWPAAWMMPSDPFRYASRCSSLKEWQGNPDCDAWPNSGEIDIMEFVGYDNTLVHGTVHNKAYYWVNGQQRKGSIEVRDVTDTFHVYSLEWEPGQIRIYMDGSLYFSYSRGASDWRAWPYDHAFHTILNLAIGGGWGSAGGPVDNSIFPVRYEVDYVRYFKLNAPIDG